MAVVKRFLERPTSEMSDRILRILRITLPKSIPTSPDSSTPYSAEFFTSWSLVAHAISACHPSVERVSQTEARGVECLEVLSPSPEYVVRDQP